MMFQTIQTIYFLWVYDPGNMSVSFIAELSPVYCCLVLEFFKMCSRIVCRCCLSWDVVKEEAGDFLMVLPTKLKWAVSVKQVACLPEFLLNLGNFGHLTNSSYQFLPIQNLILPPMRGWVSCIGVSLFLKTKMSCNWKISNLYLFGFSSCCQFHIVTKLNDLSRWLVGEMQPKFHLKVWIVMSLLPLSIFAWWQQQS